MKKKVHCQPVIQQPGRGRIMSYCVLEKITFICDVSFILYLFLKPFLKKKNLMPVNECPTLSYLVQFKSEKLRVATHCVPGFGGL